MPALTAPGLARLAPHVGDAPGIPLASGASVIWRRQRPSLGNTTRGTGSCSPAGQSAAKSTRARRLAPAGDGLPCPAPCLISARSSSPPPEGPLQGVAEIVLHLQPHLGVAGRRPPALPSPGTGGEILPAPRGAGQAASPHPLPPGPAAPGCGAPARAGLPWAVVTTWRPGSVEQRAASCCSRQRICWLMVDWVRCIHARRLG